ncbi:hypothetical protein CARUB_v100194922mg, partial [Capsella rubella]
IPGAIESISSLLERTRDSYQAAYNIWTLNNLGLLILKRLAQHHDNSSEKIGKIK